MTRNEIRKHVFQWIDEESLIERLCERVCCDCPAWQYDGCTGETYCPIEDPTLDSCVRWYEVDSYLERMVLADNLLVDVFGDRLGDRHD